MKNITWIRTALKSAYSRTSFYPRTNETYYPAKWYYGSGAGDASTSDHYDTRLQRSVERVAHRLGLRDFQSYATTQREAALDLFEAQRDYDESLKRREELAISE